MNVIVTGASGFLAAKLINQLLNNNYFVIGIDKIGNKRLKNSKYYKHISCDITNLNELKIKFKNINIIFDFLIHTAALQPLSQKQNFIEMFNVNFIGTKNILYLCNTLKIRKIIYSSSFSVYGKQKKLPIKEISKKTPDNYYGLSKLLSESIIEFFAKKNLIKYIIVRFDGIYGYNQNMPGFIEMCYENLIKNKNIELYNKGKQIRDQIYVDDAVNSIIFLMKKIKVIKSNIFNVGGGFPQNNYKLSKVISKLLKSNSKIIKVDKINPNICDIYLDMTKIRKLGYNPTKTIHCLKKYVNERKKNA